MRRCDESEPTSYPVPLRLLRNGHAIAGSAAACLARWRSGWFNNAGCSGSSTSKGATSGNATRSLGVVSISRWLRRVPRSTDLPADHSHCEHDHSADRCRSHCRGGCCGRSWLVEDGVRSGRRHWAGHHQCASWNAFTFLTGHDLCRFELRARAVGSHSRSRTMLPRGRSSVLTAERSRRSLTSSRPGRRLKPRLEQAASLFCSTHRHWATRRCCWACWRW